MPRLNKKPSAKNKLMKKVLITAFLFICPAAFCFGQINVSGLAGKDGYSVMRASLNVGVPFVPGLSLTPGYARYTQDNIDAMSQYSLGAAYQVPLIDILEIGGGGSYMPKVNYYSNYSWNAYAALNIQTLLFNLIPTDELKIGAGFKNTEHKFYEPSSNVNESDVYAFLYQKTGGFDTSVNFAKSISFSGQRQRTPPWLDIPDLGPIYAGYLDYSLGATAGYTYKFIRPFASYTWIKTKDYPSTDDAKLGLTLKVAMVNVNAAVEWLNFSKNSADRQTFYSLNAGVSFGGASMGFNFL